MPSIPDFFSQIIEVSGPVDERGDGVDVEALFAGQQHLRLVGDRQVGASRGEQLERRRRIGGGLDSTSRPASSK